MYLVVDTSFRRGMVVLSHILLICRDTSEIILSLG